MGSGGRLSSAMRDTFIISTRTSRHKLKSTGNNGSAYPDQVEHAFLMQPSVDEIALVACCGEWWFWMISTCAAYIMQELSLPQGLAGPPAEITVEELELRTRESHPRPAKMHPGEIS